MKLLNKYQSRVFQFALELMSRLEYGRGLEAGDISRLAHRTGLDYAGQVLDPLVSSGLLEKEGNTVSLSEDLRPPHLPMGQMEREFLADSLNRPEAALFLEEITREKLQKILGPTNFFDPIQRLSPAGEPLPAQPGGPGFRTLLEAIRKKYRISYLFRTRTDTVPRPGEALPWKLEYSAYDRRWWVILYAPEQQRTIKARLENLSDIRLLGPAHVPEGEVAAALDRLLEPEPAVLEVRHTRGALERCFLTFEDQMFVKTSQVSEDRFRLAFRYYRFDQGEILRRLLYLGPAVELLEPASLREELAGLLDKALL